MAVIRFFRTFRDGKPMTIALTEESAWSSLASYWRFKEEERACWSVQAQESDIPRVPGVLRIGGDDGEPMAHVHWVCPKCKREHCTDVALADLGPGLWYCEIGGTEDVFLVDWGSRTDSLACDP